MFEFFKMLAAQIAADQRCMRLLRGRSFMEGDSRGCMTNIKELGVKDESPPRRPCMLYVHITTADQHSC